MILAVGLDLCEVPRMQKALADGAFLRRFFTQEEQAYVADRGKAGGETLAGLFAAKEACLKALGCGLSLPLTDIEIGHDALRAPFYRLSGKVLARFEELGGRTLHLSITHTDALAAAVAVLEGVPGGLKARGPYHARYAAGQAALAARDVLIDGMLLGAVRHDTRLRRVYADFAPASARRQASLAFESVAYFAMTGYDGGASAVESAAFADAKEARAWAALPSGSQPLMAMRIAFAGGGQLLVACEAVDYTEETAM